MAEPTGTPLIRVENLVKFFPVRGLPFGRVQSYVHAVDGVSFAIHAGQTLSLVGESGCGKTTTSRLILLLDRPTRGAIYFEGRSVQTLTRQQLKQYRSSVQAVFQDPWSSLNPRMRVRDIIAEPADINLRLTKRKRGDLVARVLTEVGLDPAVADHYPHEFSGGQRQRVALARALAMNSKLVVLDEPVSALDVSIRAQIMNLLKRVQVDHGMSYLLIAHNLATVRYLSDAVAVMYLGQLMEMADAEELFISPLHPYTVALISASASARPDESPSLILPGEVPSPADPPSGCRFRTRCWLRERLGDPANCTTDEPPLREVKEGHQVACHWADQVESHMPRTPS